MSFLWQFLGFQSYPRYKRCIYCNEEYEEDDEHLHIHCKNEVNDKPKEKEQTKE
jgi:hypothetical protein